MNITTIVASPTANPGACARAWFTGLMCTCTACCQLR
jgi:hypothetical protein